MSKVLLIILDGFGYSEIKEHNAIEMAKMPFYKNLLKEYPHALLKTSGEFVGLPAGVMGNSEVGHLNIGGGRIIPQEYTRISLFAKTQGFETLSELKRVFQEKTGSLHIWGLLSDGGVHSHQENLFLLVKAVQKVNPSKKVFIHVITDGRDTPPQSAVEYVAQLENEIKNLPNVKISTVVGRFYAMDRDKRWERVQLAYEAITGGGKFLTFSSASEAVQDAYANKENDEFIKPRLISGGERLTAEDQVVFFNFRADRAREISQAIALPGFAEFSAPVKVKPESYITFTQYQKNFPFPVLFTPKKYEKLLGEVVSAHGLKQLRIAETEKYAHVTYFFNGGAENPYDKEDRILIPSPKEVATYDLKPEMSARVVTEDLCKKLGTGEYDLAVVNFANGDMVGHTGVESAAIQACEVLDECLTKVVKQALKEKYEIIITADHGNCEMMVEPKTQKPFTQHTTFEVPVVWVGERAKGQKITNGILADIAPSILQLMNISQPKEMTGKSFLILS